MSEQHHKWETDAGNISSYSMLQKFVYRNNSVTEFIDDNNKYFVVAAKGIGKTLMLTYKRFVLETRYRDQKSIMFIPKRHPYIGFIDSIKQRISSEYISKFTDWEYCKRFWLFIIKLTALSHVGVDIKLLEKEMSNRCARYITILSHLLTSHLAAFEYIFNELLSMNETALIRFIDTVSHVVSSLFLKIENQTIIFLDRLDGALEEAHEQIWSSLQIGLLEAAWDAMRSNTNVKIYLSIRHEAFVEHTSPNKFALLGAVVEIKYEKPELDDLLKHLLKYYEGAASLKDFLGFSTFPNIADNSEEDIFEFMYRYSVIRPRDYVTYCNRLSIEINSIPGDSAKKKSELKRIIKDVASDAVSNLHAELKMLMNCLTSEDRLKTFISEIERNIFEYKDVISICKGYNGEKCEDDCERCPAEQQPFVDLYNLGLFGILYEEYIGAGKIQRFKTPYEKVSNRLPSKSEYFFTHPSLTKYINDNSMSADKNYCTLIGIKVGNKLKWSQKNIEYYRISVLISKISDFEIRSCLHEIFIKYLRTNQILAGEEFDSIKNHEYTFYEDRVIDALVNYFTSGTYLEPDPISIFLSYAYDSSYHKSKVESFCNKLNSWGFKAMMDTSMKESFPDLDKLMTEGMKQDRVIVVLSEEYKRKADDTVGGVWVEFKMIASDLEDNPCKYIFVCFDGLTVDIIKKIRPTRIGSRWIIDLENGKKDNYGELVSWIKGEAEKNFMPVNKDVVDFGKKLIPSF